MFIKETIMNVSGILGDTFFISNPTISWKNNSKIFGRDDIHVKWQIVQAFNTPQLDQGLKTTAGYFPWNTGCLIGILKMVCEIILHITG